MTFTWLTQFLSKIFDNGFPDQKKAIKFDFSSHLSPRISFLSRCGLYGFKSWHSLKLYSSLVLRVSDCYHLVLAFQNFIPHNTYSHFTTVYLKCRSMFKSIASLDRQHRQWNHKYLANECRICVTECQLLFAFRCIPFVAQTFYRNWGSLSKCLFNRMLWERDGRLQ